VTIVNGTSGSLVLPSATTTINSAGTACGSTTINVPITGVGPLTAFGCGTTTLGGANTYSGDTTVTSGSTLTIGSAGKLGNGSYAGAIANSGTFTYASSAAQTLSGAFSSISGTFNVNGTGTLTLSGTTDNNSLGATVNSGGKLVLAKTSSGSVHALGGVTTVNSGGTLQLGGTGGDQIYSGVTITVASGGVFDGNGLSESMTALSLSGTGISSGGALINSAASTTSTITGTAATGIPLTANSSIGGVGNITIPSVIGGAFTLTKVGAGALTLSGANTFTGVTLNAGTLNIGNASALSSGTFTITGSSGTDFFDNTTGSDLTVANAFSLQGGPTYVGSANNMTINGAVNLTANRNLTVAAKSLTLGGQITGAFVLSKLGAGTLVLKNSGTADTHSGTTISAGTLDLGGTSQTLGAVTFSGTATTQNGKVNGSSYTASLTSGTATISAVLAGSGATFSQTGSGGTVILSGANTYSGGTTIKAGQITIAGGSSGTSGPLGPNTSTVNLGDTTGAASATLAFSSTAQTHAYPLVVQSGSSGTKTMMNAASTAYAWSGSVTLNDSFTLDAGTGSGSINVSGAVTGAGGVTINTSGGSGTVTLSKASSGNTYAGNTTITQGILRPGSATAIPNGASKGIVALNPTSPNTATFDLSGQNQTINGLSSSGTGSAVVDNSSGSSTYTLTVGTSGSNPNTTFVGAIQNSSGTIALTKAGSGTLTLSGVNTYAGNTTISAGTLEGGVSGSIPGNVTASAGTLQLDNASAMASGATLTLATSPGAGAVNLNFSGTQPISALNFGATSKAQGTWGATGSGATHQNAAFTGSGLLNVTTGGSSQTITFSNPGTQTYGVAPVTLTATASSSVAVTYTVTSGPASVAGSTLTITGAGSVTVQAEQAGNDNFNPASPVSQTFTVNPLPVQLSGTRSYDGSTTADYSILSVANAISPDSVNAASGSGTLSGANPGSQAITSFGSLALGNNAAGNYTLTGASGSVTITNASTTNNVAASPNPSLPGADVTFTSAPGAVPPGAGTPTGNVQFKTNGVALGDPVVLDGSGIATLVTNILPHGSITVSAEYAGDVNFLGSTNSVVQVVNTPPTHSDSTAGVTANTSLVLSATKLLVTASDADAGDTLSVTAAGPTSTNGPPSNVVLDTGAGTITYTPATDYVGSDSFTYTISDNFGGTVTPTVFVTVTSANVPSPNIVVPPAYDSGSGTFSVTFAGIPGYTYTIQTATDPSGPWSFLKTSTAGTDGLFQVLDTESPPPPARYYRTVYP
jgi:autotransporter-associated beta strand protein